MRPSALAISEHDPEKWVPVFGKDHAPTIEHDPEKWVPVFGKDHAPTTSWSRDDDSKKGHPALVPRRIGTALVADMRLIYHDQ
jgi:hypothetical protein